MKEKKIRLQTTQIITVSSFYCFQTNKSIKQSVSLVKGLPAPSIRIKDALESCPIKVEYFKKPAIPDKIATEKVFNDKLLNDLDDYLSEIRPKTYSFVTDGIETKTDIAHLGMSDNQLKKMNRVSETVAAESKFRVHMMIFSSVSDILSGFSF